MRSTSLFSMSQPGAKRTSRSGGHWNRISRPLFPLWPDHPPALLALLPLLTESSIIIRRMTITPHPVWQLIRAINRSNWWNKTCPLIVFISFSALIAASLNDNNFIPLFSWGCLGFVVVQATNAAWVEVRPWKTSLVESSELRVDCFVKICSAEAVISLVIFLYHGRRRPCPGSSSHGSRGKNRVLKGRNLLLTGSRFFPQENQWLTSL